MKDNKLLKQEIWERLLKIYPFEGYIKTERRNAYFEIPEAITQLADKKSKVLDFGAGSCDKTAVLALLGYSVDAYDDLMDDWYNYGNNKEDILKFADSVGITYYYPKDGKPNIPMNKKYDVIILNNVIEHIHDSPRYILNSLIELLNPEGYLVIAVPNAVNLRKRISIIFGQTNYPSFSSFYWSPNNWRGHIREYVKTDLVLLNKYLSFETIRLDSHHYHLERLSKVARLFFIIICKMFPGFRESWLYIGKKPKGWEPRKSPTNTEFQSAYEKQYYKPSESVVTWKK